MTLQLIKPLVAHIRTHVDHHELVTDDNIITKVSQIFSNWRDTLRSASEKEQAAAVVLLQQKVAELQAQIAAVQVALHSLLMSYQVSATLMVDANVFLGYSCYCCTCKISRGLCKSMAYSCICLQVLQLQPCQQGGGSETDRLLQLPPTVCLPIMDTAADCCADVHAWCMTQILPNR